MSMCVFAKKPSSSHLQDNLKKLKWFITKHTFNQKSRITALCARYRQHLAILMKTFLNPPESEAFLNSLGWGSVLACEGNAGSLVAKCETHLNFIIDTHAGKKKKKNEEMRVVLQPLFKCNDNSTGKKTVDKQITSEY